MTVELTLEEIESLSTEEKEKLLLKYQRETADLIKENHELVRKGHELLTESHMKLKELTEETSEKETYSNITAEDFVHRFSMILSYMPNEEVAKVINKMEVMFFSRRPFDK